MILESIFLIVTNIATGALIILSVLLLNPAISITMLVGLAGGYAAIYFRVRKRLLDLGRRHSRACTEQAKVVNETLGAIKEVLLLQDRGSFPGDSSRRLGVSRRPRVIFITSDRFRNTSWSAWRSRLWSGLLCC